MKYKKDLWRFLAVGVLVTLLAGSISAVSYAFDRDERVLNEEGDWSLKTAVDNRKNGAATPSSASTRSLRGSEAPASPSDMLEQTGSEAGVIEVEWFRVLVDGETVRDSERPHLAMKEGKEIPPDGQLKYQLKINFYVDQGGIEADNYVEWTLGNFPGLALPEESWEDIVMDGDLFGEAYLRYEEDNTLILGTVFSENVDQYSAVYINYTYESGFQPVDEATSLDFRFPGRDGTTEAILLPTEQIGPVDPPDPNPSEPETSKPNPTEPTEPETSKPDPTNPTEPETSKPNPTDPTEPTEPETSKPNPTEPTTSGRPSGSGHSDHGGGHSSTNTETLQTTGSAAAETPTAASKPAVESPSKAAPKAVAAAPESSAALESQAAPESPPPPAASIKATSAKATSTDPKAADPTTSALAPELTIQAEYTIDAPAPAAPTQSVQNGAALTCQIQVQNTGSTPANEIRLRDYLPKHTSFLSASGGGTWGILDGAERVTWKLDTLKPGESRTLEVKLQVYLCTPEGYRLEQAIYWQADDSESVHSAVDPANSAAVPAVTVQ